MESTPVCYFHLGKLAPMEVGPSQCYSGVFEMAARLEFVVFQGQAVSFHWDPSSLCPFCSTFEEKALPLEPLDGKIEGTSREPEKGQPGSTSTPSLS